jgi:hypothetical protein
MGDSVAAFVLDHILQPHLAQVIVDDCLARREPERLDQLAHPHPGSLRLRPQQPVTLVLERIQHRRTLQTPKPPELATSNGREKWFEAARRWLDDERAEQAAPVPRDRPKRVKEAKRRMDEQLWTDRLGPNTVPKPYAPPPVPPGTINLTDPDSRMVKGQHGWLQGYNAQAASNEHRIVIAAEIEVVSPDFGHLERTVAAARRELEAVGIDDAPKVVLADSGYWHTEQIDRLAADGIAVLIPPESGLRKTPRPGWNSRRYAFMRAVLKTEHGTALYSQRQHLIETLFGSIKHNRNFTRLHRRGRAAVRTERRLITATHNLIKLHKHHLAATAA